MSIFDRKNPKQFSTPCLNYQIIYLSVTMPLILCLRVAVCDYVNGCFLFIPPPKVCTFVATTTENRKKSKGTKEEEKTGIIVLVFRIHSTVN